MAPDQQSLRSQSPARTSFNFKQMKNDEQIITNKIAYEWKNIYRQLISDSFGGEVVDIRTFDGACLKFQVNFTREELRKIKNLFNIDPDQNIANQLSDTDQINFVKISHQLGLHRDSYNYLSKSMTSNRAKSLQKIRQFYKSIEPVEEENEEVDIQEIKQHKKSMSQMPKNKRDEDDVVNHDLAEGGRKFIATFVKKNGKGLTES